MKRIIICCDGTWNRADQGTNDEPCPTNVVKIAYRIAKRDAYGTPQIVYYGQGVGTGNVLDKYSGGAFGEGLEDNIHDAYRFLVANYEPNDELFLFGFSRGAFTVRSLGGMIRNCGILKRESIRHYRAALQLYRDHGRPPDHEASQAFRQRHALGGDVPIRITFLGVWDTVGSLGIPLRGLRSLTRSRHQFHDTELSGSVATACHALAIDERRGPFEPTLWSYKPKEDQKVEQVWFCGVHSDVGGGYPTSGLSDITLEWMTKKAESAGLGFDEKVLQELPLNSDPEGVLNDSRKGLYRASPAVNRMIGVSQFTSRDDGRKKGYTSGDPTQSIHESVLKRWDSISSYRPASLMAYLKMTGDPRTTS